MRTIETFINFSFFACLIFLQVLLLFVYLNKYTHTHELFRIVENEKFFVVDFFVCLVSCIIIGYLFLSINFYWLLLIIFNEIFSSISMMMMKKKLKLFHPIMLDNINVGVSLGFCLCSSFFQRSFPSF